MLGQACIPRHAPRRPCRRRCLSGENIMNYRAAWPPSQCRQPARQPAALVAAPADAGAVAHPLGRSDRDHPSPVAAGAGRDRHGYAPSRGARDPGPRRRHASTASACGSAARSSRQALKTPPAEFTFHARNPAHNIQIGGKWIAFAPGRRPAQLLRPRPRPAARDARGQRQFHQAVRSSSTASTRRATARSMRSMSMPRSAICISCATRCAIPTRCPSSISTGRARLLDSLEITRLARGISRGAVPARALRLHRHQHQFAAQARRSDGHGHHRDGAAQPDLRGDALHACWAPWRR